MNTNQNQHPPSDVLIIGAGICGLNAATVLQKKGQTAALLEKSRGVGGRMATRRINDAVLDHGAQFFTARSEGFQQFVHSMMKESIVDVWCHGFETEDRHPRYFCPGGMTALPKHLANGLDIHFSQRAIQIEQVETYWRVYTDQGMVYQSSNLLITSPLPQSVELVDNSQLRIDETVMKPLRAIEYDPCIALLMTFDSKTNIPPPGAIQVKGDPIAFVADNVQKKTSPVHSMTVHTSPQFSRANYTNDDQSIMSQLMGAIQHWLPGPPTEIQVKRWKFSQPQQVLNDRFAVIHQSPNLLLAGDAFCEARVEGAWLSGLHAATFLLETNE